MKRVIEFEEIRVHKHRVFVEGSANDIKDICRQNYKTFTDVIHEIDNIGATVLNYERDFIGPKIEGCSYVDDYQMNE